MSLSTKVTLRDNNRNILRLNHKNMPDDIVYSLQLSGYALKTDIPSSLSGLIDNNGNITGYTETDPIYTADKPNLALKSELFSKSYNDLTDKPTNVQEMGISITTDDIISNYGAGDNLTNELANILLNMWMNVEQLFNNRNYVKTINGILADDDGNFDLSIDLSNVGYRSVNKIESIYPLTEYIEIPATSLDEIKDRYMVHLNSEYPWIQFPQFGNLPGDPTILWTESIEPCERTFEIWLEDYYNFGLLTIDYGSVQIINPDSIDTTTGGIHVFTVRIAYVPDPGDCIMLLKTVTASYSYTFMN